jgi:hypothetical protein
MKKLLRTSLVLLLWLAAAAVVSAQGTAFTYQGRFSQGGAAFTGSAEMQFTLWNAATNGTQLAATIPAIQAVTVSNGLFTASIDFTSAPFTGADRWMQIEARTTLGAFTTLTPRQKITATPYATYAGSVNSAGITGTIADSQLSGNIARLNSNLVFTGAVQFNNTNNSFSGAFTGNGAGLTNVSVDSLVVTTTNVSVVRWGYNGGETTVPAGLTNVTAAAAGFSHCLAVTGDGTLVQWGYIDSFANPPPPGTSNIRRVAAGYDHDLALRRDGTILAWGYNNNGETNVPPGLNGVSAVAAGLYLSLALKSNGTVVAWGNNGVGQTNVPAGLSNVVAIAAGGQHSLALKNNGTVVAWGNNFSGQINVPPGLNNVVAVAGGSFHSLALKSDGTIVAWGDNSVGQITVPAGLTNVTAISAGDGHSLALKSDGRVVAWGFNSEGQTDVPLGLRNVIALAPGPVAYQTLAIRTYAYSPVALLDVDSTFNSNIELNGMFVGKVGIGTATPSQLLHLNVTPGHGEGMQIDSAIAGHSPAIYLNHIGNGGRNFRLASYGDNASPGSFVIRDDTAGLDRFSIDQNGVVTGNGAGLTALNASNVSSGTLTDARLSANIPRLNGNQAFTGNNLFAGSVGIGANPPQQQLSVGAGLNLDQNNGNAGTVGNALTFGSSSGEGIGSKRTAGGNQYGLDFYSGAINRLSIANNGSIAIAGSSSLSFGAQTRQMLNLWGTQYGIGVQSETLYFRCDNSGSGGFMWYKGGVHNDAYANSGGGTELMHLVAGGLYVSTTVYGSSSGNGVQGTSTGGGTSGVYGENLSGGGYGLAGRASGSGTAVFGDNANAAGWAGYFIGNVRVTGTINPPSDRNVKRDFAQVDHRAILEKVAALPIQTWAYTNDSRGTRHLGPVAQDFQKAFGLGADDTSIATVDADGVALAAIQGLNQKVNELSTELKRRDAENTDLKKSIEDLRRIVLKSLAKQSE